LGSPIAARIGERQNLHRTISEPIWNFSVPPRVFAFMASRFGGVYVSLGLGMPSGRADCGSAVPNIEQPYHKRFTTRLGIALA
jgi:hypothetical protein